VKIEDIMSTNWKKIRN